MRNQSNLVNDMGIKSALSQDLKELEKSQMLEKSQRLKSKTLKIQNNKDESMMAFWQFMTYAEKLKEYPEKEDYRKKGVNLYPPVSVEVVYNNALNCYDKDIKGYQKYQTYYFPYTENFLVTEQRLIDAYCYQKEDKQKMQDLNNLYSRHIGGLMRELNIVAKDEGDAVAFVKKHADIVKRLPAAYKTVGYVNDNGLLYANISMLQNMIKRMPNPAGVKGKDYYSEIVGPEHKQLEHEKALREYFNKTNSYVLAENCKFQLKSYRGGQSELGIFKNKVTNLVIGEASLSIKMNERNPQSRQTEFINDQTMEILSNWLSQDHVSFGEIEFIFQEGCSFLDIQKFQTLISTIKAQYDAIIIDGTTNLFNQSLKNQDKLVDSLLLSITKYDIQQLHSIQKLQISNCYISDQTFTLLGQVIQNCQNLQEIDIRGIKLGNFVERKIVLANQEKELQCGEYCCGDCCANFQLFRCMCYCFSCCKVKKQSNSALNKEILQKIEEHNEELILSVTPVDFTEIIQAFKSNKHKIFLSTFIASDINWNHLAHPDQVNDFLTALAHTKPFSINLQNCHLSDRHIIGLVNLLQSNDRLMHLDISQNVFKESLMEIDNLIRSMPFLISAYFTWVDKKEYVQQDIERPYQNEVAYMDVCCCIPVSTKLFDQKKKEDKIYFPFNTSTKDHNELENIKNFEESIREEVRKHRLMTYNHFLKFQAPGDSLIMRRKKKKLDNYIREKHWNFIEIFRDEKMGVVKEWREAIRKEFVEKHKLNVQEIDELDYEKWMEILGEYQQTQYELDKDIPEEEKDFREIKHVNNATQNNVPVNGDNKKPKNGGDYGNSELPMYSVNSIFSPDPKKQGGGDGGGEVFNSNFKSQNENYNNSDIKNNNSHVNDITPASINAPPPNYLPLDQDYVEEKKQQNIPYQQKNYKDIYESLREDITTNNNVNQQINQDQNDKNNQNNQEQVQILTDEQGQMHHAFSFDNIQLNKKEFNNQTVENFYKPDNSDKPISQFSIHGLKTDENRELNLQNSQMQLGQKAIQIQDGEKDYENVLQQEFAKQQQN